MKQEWFRKYFGLSYILGDNTKAFNFNGLKERTKADLDQIVGLSQTNSGSKVLDIPCGYGRHSIELASRSNYRISGLDLDTFLIKVANYRAEHSLDVEENYIELIQKPKFVIGDMRDFSNELNDFDLVFNWFWSFGYFSHPENLRVLCEFYSALKHRGKLLIHTIPRENLSQYRQGVWRQVSNLKIMGHEYPKGNLQYTNFYEAKKGLLHTSWSVKLDDGTVFPEEYIESSVLMYSTEEYVDMFKETGFKNIEVDSSYLPFKIFIGKK
ncbi:MAG: class I SAM-dependent methyltransferase [Nanoarchaeota archaeon]|nr:class I SAM-dependent methyltransferase [Nanoarchaeota archaeon]